MIAKIGRNANLYGTLAYNQCKVEKGKGQILFVNKIIETPDGQYSAIQLARSFEFYLAANRNTEKPVVHISLNPDPGDKVSDEKFKQIAEQYMEEMGYGLQPYAVFKHTDIDRTHIHIVTVCVDEEGKKISDKFEKRRSMHICREMEIKYGLQPAAEKENRDTKNYFRPLDYQKGDIKSQIASVVRYLPEHYKFQTLGEYNALLSLFNITVEKVEGERYGKTQKGLVYIPLKEDGERAGQPLKASLFGKAAGLPALDLHFEKSREILRNDQSKATLKSVLATALKLELSEKDFKNHLTDKGINIVVRSNDKGRIYGMTFIDHNSRTVWNGSSLGKEFSANVFNDYWNNNSKPNIQEIINLQPKQPQHKEGDDLPDETPHKLFDFLSKETHDFNAGQIGIIEAIGGLLPESQDQYYEEQDFVGRMKRKRKTRR